MKVEITDIATSLRLIKELGQLEHLLPIKPEYGWQMRSSMHTPLELEYGREQNPQMIDMPIAEFRELEGKPVEEREIGYTAVCFPSQNRWTPYMRCIPAYPKEVGYEGTYIEVELRD